MFGSSLGTWPSKFICNLYIPFSCKNRNFRFCSVMANNRQFFTIGNASRLVQYASPVWIIWMIGEKTQPIQGTNIPPPIYWQNEKPCVIRRRGRNSQPNVYCLNIDLADFFGLGHVLPFSFNEWVHNLQWRTYFFNGQKNVQEAYGSDY
jgi:hypothetical protein